MLRKNNAGISISSSNNGKRKTFTTLFKTLAYDVAGVEGNRPSHDMRSSNTFIWCLFVCWWKSRHPKTTAASTSLLIS